MMSTAFLREWIGKKETNEKKCNLSFRKTETQLKGGHAPTMSGAAYAAAKAHIR
jgi:hypothetical protein